MARVELQVKLSEILLLANAPTDLFLFLKRRCVASISEVSICFRKLLDLDKCRNVTIS